MIVMKFGGTSVGGSEAIARTVEIIRGRLGKKPVVVVSAMTKITDLLYRIADAAASKDLRGVEENVRDLRERHIATAEQLLENDAVNLLPAISRVN